MTGILLIILGLFLIIVGVIVYNNGVKTEGKQAESVADLNSPGGTELNTNSYAEKSSTNDYSENAKKGTEFEQFVVQRFSKKYFTVKSWTGDKGVDGRYAESNKDPDLVMELKLHGKRYNFAVECKWRNSYYNQGIEFASTEQLERYRNYATTSSLDVYLAVGVGGSPAAPDEFFILPLNQVKSNFLPKNLLNSYRKKQPSANLFYDPENRVLN